MKLLPLSKMACFLFFLFLSGIANSQVVINEYSCSNMNGPLDAFGEREDWVELFNAGAAAVDLSGYYLSDNDNNPQKWQIPAGSGSIAPGGYKMAGWLNGLATAIIARYSAATNAAVHAHTKHYTARYKSGFLWTPARNAVD